MFCVPDQLVLALPHDRMAPLARDLCRSASVADPAVGIRQQPASVAHRLYPFGVARDCRDRARGDWCLRTGRHPLCLQVSVVTLDRSAAATDSLRAAPWLG